VFLCARNGAVLRHAAYSAGAGGHRVQAKWLRRYEALYIGLRVAPKREVQMPFRDESLLGFVDERQSDVCLLE